jgi:hypothetical protein
VQADRVVVKLEIAIEIAGIPAVDGPVEHIPIRTHFYLP